MSVELITNPAWQIFEPEHLDLSTVEYEMVEYRELNVTNTVALTTYQIETRDKDSFLKPHDGHLEVRFNITQTAGTVPTAGNGATIPETDVIALQNNALSLFKNIEYQIEDQRIEYCDEPATGYTIKNLADFSKQYGESIASNQHFFLDTKDEATTPACNIRFFNNTAPRAGTELFFVQNGNNELQPNIAVAPNNAATTGFFTGDSVVAYVNVTSINLGVANGVTGTPVIFYTVPGNTGVKVGGNLTVGDGTRPRLLLSGGANGNFVGAYVEGNGASVNFLRGDATQVPPAIATTVLLPSQLILTATPVISITDGAANQIFTANAYFPQSNCDFLTNNFFSQPYNVGFTQRAALAANSSEISVWIPLKNMFLFCRSYDKISRGLRHKLILNRQDDSQMLYRNNGGGTAGGTGGVDRFVVITYISCWIPRLKPSLDTLKMLESKLSSSELYTINFTDLTVWRLNTVQTGNAANSAFQLATTSKKPIRVWVAFQRAERVNPTQIWNKRIFDNLNTTNLQVRLNGRQYPLYEYKIGTPFSEYNRVYQAFLASGHKWDHSDGSLIDVNTYANLYSIFYCDLTAQDEDLWKAVKYAELEIRYSNQAAAIAPNGFYCHVIYESERIIKFKGISGSLALEL